MAESQDDPVQFFVCHPSFDDDGDVDSEAEAVTVATLSQSPDTYMIGFIIVNIVGIQYYSGRISGREMVGLVREPLNPHDENAIRILNTRSIQVGHIERTAARVLAPLIDESLIFVEGIVPKNSSKGNRYKIPCQVHIFARAEAFPRVKSAIDRGGLQLITENDASFTLSDSVVVKEKKNSKETRSLDEIFKLLDDNLSKKGVMEVMEAPKDVVKSELFLHQKEGLAWLYHRENSQDLPPFWEEKNGAYVNVLTNYQTDKRPEPMRGGIFADDMGLGKTLTLLSLISLDKFGSLHASSSSTINGDENEEVNEDVFSSGKNSKRKRASKNDTRKKKKNEEIGLNKTTLIVCPPSVFSSWITQLGEHTKPGRLKVYMYYGERTQDVDELRKYDIVMTTYSTLAAEESWPDSPVKKMEWWRVILDEAHTIKNVNAQQSKAVSKLNANRRWAVTGTPIQNGSFDLFSLMAFLKFEPFSIKSYWNSLVQRPISQGNQKGLSRLQVLMATISLRRTKDNAIIGLPPKSIETCFVELSDEERQLYDKMEGEAKSVVQSYISDDSIMRNYSTVLSIILRLRQICTDVALCPPDLRASLASSPIEDVSNNPELLQKMVAALQDGEDFDCPICISPPNDMVITCCAHIFCRSCILKTLKRTKPSCPLCRRSITESDLFSAPPEQISGDQDVSGGSSSVMSSKVSTLLKLLKESRKQNPSTKSIVFSQFRKMLILLEEPLKAAGFKILRLDGSMNAKKRAQVIEEFKVPAPEGPTILLASLKASGTGINLTAASRVYLLEPWWNPAVEEQAMDRVHRIGQTEEVRVIRMFAKNSIEERILDLQEKKMMLAKEAFGKRASQKDRKEIGINDLRMLMSL